MGEHKHNATAIAAATRPKCGSCVHFFTEQPGHPAHGHCRALPPSTAFGIKQSLGQIQEIIKSAYPPQTADKWCGAHPDFTRWFSEYREQYAAAVQIGDVETEGQA